MKVCFVDEVASEAFRQQEAAASAAAQKTAISIPQPIQNHSSSHYYSMPPRLPMPDSRPRVESPPLLPDYEMALQRMRQIGRQGRLASLLRRPDQSQRGSATRGVSGGLRICANSHYKNDDYEADEEVFQSANPFQGISYRTSTLLRQGLGPGGDKRLSEAKFLENLASATSPDGGGNQGRQMGVSFESNNQKTLTPSKSCENLQQAASRGQLAMTVSASNPVSIKDSWEWKWSQVWK